MRIKMLQVVRDGEMRAVINHLRDEGVDLIDVNNGAPTLYRGYMSVKYNELWEVDTHGRREYWIMAHCPFSTRYMWKFRYVVTNRFRVINGVAGNEWKETRSAALRAAGKYGSVYLYDFDYCGSWSSVLKIYGNEVHTAYVRR